tara:strand:- start:304 stop:708 length:405 start_codon:yes stop_codon:yes gene_type:complete
MRHRNDLSASPMASRPQVSILLLFASVYHPRLRCFVPIEPIHEDELLLGVPNNVILKHDFIGPDMICMNLLSLRKDDDAYSHGIVSHSHYVSIGVERRLGRGARILCVRFHHRPAGIMVVMGLLHTAHAEKREN